MSFNRIEISKIKIEPIGGKLWVKVYFNNGTEWIPALWEQGYIAYAVAKCEEKKYKNLPWDAKKKPRDYLIQCLNAKNDEEFKNITEEFELDYDKNGLIRKSFLRLLNAIQK